MIIRTTRTRAQARLAVGKGSLIGYWPLDDKSGTTAKDRSGNARDAAYSGTYTLRSPGTGNGTPVLGDDEAMAVRAALKRAVTPADVAAAFRGEG